MPQTHDAPRKRAPFRHDNHKQIIRTARHWLRVSTAKLSSGRQNRRYTAPACRFCIIKIFQFYFFTKGMARPRRCWVSAGVRQLKRAQWISVFFSCLDL